MSTALDSRGEIIPLSMQQERHWLLTKLASDEVNIPPVALRLKGAPVVDALRRALNQLVTRHESLRTAFRNVGGVPEQIVLPSAEVTLSMQDLRSTPPSKQAKKVTAIVRREAQRAFPLAQEPLLRAGLIRLDEREHVLHFTMHHIVSDLWSMKLFVRELGNLYSAAATGQQSKLKPTVAQFRDFILWERQWEEGRDAQRHLTYWQRKLADAEALRLPTDWPRQREDQPGSDQMSIVIPPDIARDVRELSKREGVTVFMTLLGAFLVLLCRWCGQNDLVVGSLCANRPRAEFEPLIGCFSHRFVLRTDLRGDLAFRDLLARVREVCLEAYEHQGWPFWKLAEMTPGQNLSSLTKVYFALQKVPIEVSEFSGLKVSPWLETGVTTSRLFGFEQAWQIWECEKEFRLFTTFRTDLFNRATLSRMMHDFRKIIGRVAAMPTETTSQTHAALS